MDDALDDNSNPPADSASQSEMWRLFIAVAFPEEIKRDCGKLVDRLKTGIQFTGAHPAWVKTQSLHLTLAFLGATAADRVAQITDVMQRAAAASRPLVVSLSGLTLFPTPKNPRVIALHLQGDLPMLQRLQEHLSVDLFQAGFAVDERPFRPHVTLARIKSMRGLAGVRDVVEAHRNANVGTIRVDHLTLFRSHLLRDGAEYDVVAEAPLGQS